MVKAFGHAVNLKKMQVNGGCVRSLVGALRGYTWCTEKAPDLAEGWEPDASSKSVFLESVYRIAIKDCNSYAWRFAGSKGVDSILAWCSFMSQRSAHFRGLILLSKFKSDALNIWGTEEWERLTSTSNIMIQD